MYVFFFFLAEALWMEEPSQRWIFLLSSARTFFVFLFFFCYKVLFAGVTFKSSCIPAIQSRWQSPGTAQHGCVSPAVDAKVVPHQMETASCSCSGCKAAAAAALWLLASRNDRRLRRHHCLRAETRPYAPRCHYVPTLISALRPGVIIQGVAAATSM